jgi:hypothetical protein
VHELEALLPSLRAEAQALAERDRDLVREVFVFVDNWDESSEDIEENRSMAKELSQVARRFGRDGCHFVLAGSLDGSPTELRRRITSVRYGLGLRTAASLDALRVARTPPGLRGKELPEGRGYVVRSGQASMIQVASPYDGLGEDLAPDLEDEEAAARALDIWVERIQERYPDKKAALKAQPAAPSGESAPSDGGDGGAGSAKARQMLQRALKWEVDRLAQEEDYTPLVAPALAQVDPGHWVDQATLKKILTDIYSEDQKSLGIPEESTQDMVNAMDYQSLEMIVATVLPELDGDGESA